MITFTHPDPVLNLTKSVLGLDIVERQSSFLFYPFPPF